MALKSFCDKTLHFLLLFFLTCLSERSVMYEDTPIPSLGNWLNFFWGRKKRPGVPRPPLPLPHSIGCFRKHDGGRIVRLSQQGVVSTLKIPPYRWNMQRYSAKLTYGVERVRKGNQPISALVIRPSARPSRAYTQTFPSNNCETANWSEVVWVWERSQLTDSPVFHASVAVCENSLMTFSVLLKKIVLMFIQMLSEENYKYVNQTLHYYSNEFNNVIVCHHKLSFHVTVTLIRFKTPHDGRIQMCPANFKQRHWPRKAWLLL